MNKEKVSVIAVFANLILAFSKIAIGFISGSSAVFAEGLHSAVDIVSSGLGMFGIRAANKPADKEHPYGHYKIEVLTGLAITLILSLTGLWILYKSYQGFLNPTVNKINFLALGVMAFSAAVNGVMSGVKIYYGKKEQSLALLADGVHSRVDVISSLGIFAGLFLAPLSPYADPLLTLLIGLYIIKKAFGLGKEATDSLLDVSAGDEIEQKIKDIVREQEIELSDLKTQKKGLALTANILINLPKSLNVEEANKITARLHARLGLGIKNLRYIAIQISSHDIENSYYQPASIVSGIKLGQGFRWQRSGPFVNKDSKANGSGGPGGVCRCEKCGYQRDHQRGVPCSTIQCPKCGGAMIRG